MNRTTYRLEPSKLMKYVPELSQETIEAIKLIMVNAHISFENPIEGGYVSFETLNDILLFIFTPSHAKREFWAEYLGMPIEIYELNEKFDSQCQAIAKTTKKRCSNTCEGVVSHGSPPYYKKEHFFCRLHQPN